VVGLLFHTRNSEVVENLCRSGGQLAGQVCRRKQDLTASRHCSEVRHSVDCLDQRINDSAAVRSGLPVDGGWKALEAVVSGAVVVRSLIRMDRGEQPPTKLISLLYIEC
jgi:hypothetical protein